jgi:hypothetical protein
MRILIIGFLLLMLGSLGGCSISRAAVMAQEALTVLPAPPGGSINQYSAFHNLWWTYGDEDSALFGADIIQHRFPLSNTEAIDFCRSYFSRAGWNIYHEIEPGANDRNLLTFTRKSSLHGAQYVALQFETDSKDPARTLVTIQLTEDFFFDAHARRFAKQLRDMATKNRRADSMAYRCWGILLSLFL